MDAYREVDNAHQRSVDKDAHKENFMNEAVETMLRGDDFEFNDMSYSIQGDVVCRIDEDKLAECVANINTAYVLVDDGVEHQSTLNIMLNKAAYELADELYDSVKWQGRSEV